MLSYTTSGKGKGRKIALVKEAGGTKKYLYLKEDCTCKEPVLEINITKGKLIPLPNKSIVEKIYISAPSGAGKSTWCSDYIKMYKKMFKDDEIFLFSAIDTDPVLDKFDIQRVPLDMELTAEPMDVEEELSDSLVIFDDVSKIQNARIRSYVINLQDYLLECGRHYNIRMLCTSHLLMNYKATREVLNEATAVVIFPKMSSRYHIKRYLKIYIGMKPDEIKKLLELPSRWVAIYRSYPPYIIHQGGAYIISPEEDGKI